MGVKKDALLAGLFAAIVGIWIVLLAADVIPIEDQAFSAPRWIAGLAGGAFMIGGLLAVLIALPASGRARLVKSLQTTAGLALLVTFAVIGNWVAFGAGERSFSGGGGAGPLGISTNSGEWFGRAAFGLGAVLIDLILLLILVRGFRRQAGAGSDSQNR